MSIVLIVDDDPSHLQLYSLVIERGGFHPVTALAESDNVPLPENERVDLAVLDYRLGAQLSAVDVANRVRDRYPNIPIIVLSDMLWMPDDMAPYAFGFVRKGEPEQLLEMISTALSSSGIGSDALAM